MKKRKCRRRSAVLLAAVLLMAALCGCGKDAAQEGSPRGAEGTAGTEQKKGRYVEKEEALPVELADWSVMQIYETEGRLRLLAMKKDGNKVSLREYEKQDSGFADVTQGWIAAMEIVCGDWLDVCLVQGEGDTQYLYTGYMSEGEESYKGHLWKRGEGDAAQEITPAQWLEPDGSGSFAMILGMAALNNGTLAALSYNSFDILAGEDGRLISSETLSTFYESAPVTDGENVYLMSSDGSGVSIERCREGKLSEAETLPSPTSGSGSISLCILPDGGLVAAGEEGIYQWQDGEGEGSWEKLMEGIETNFGLSDYWCTGMTALEDGRIYALFQTDGGVILNWYEYDPEAVSEVKEVLRLYSVYENSLLKQAAALYHKAHPEVMISIQNVYPMYYYDTPDYDAVYQELNTMLMGDDAPDIVVMDHLNIDSYARKGLLADLNDVVKPLEDEGKLLSSITGSYVDGEGKRYVAPLHFRLNMAIGRDISVENMSSTESLASFLAGQDVSYLGPQTTADLVDKFYPYFCDEIVKDKQLDREALGRYLEYLKAIGENSGMITVRKEDEVAYGMWELASDAKLAFEEVGGFVDCMFPMSMVDYIKGDFTAFENSFIPTMQMGIYAKSPYLDTAKDFLGFALSKQVQDMDSYNGFPVNRESLETLAAKDRSNYMAATMIKGDDGNYIEFDSKSYPKETADKIMAICEKLDRPVKEDSKIREVLIESLEGYLNGAQSKEDTIQKVEDGLKMYLAE